jgi:hypothetical protein
MGEKRTGYRLLVEHRMKTNHWEEEDNNKMDLVDIG